MEDSTPSQVEAAGLPSELLCRRPFVSHQGIYREGLADPSESTRRCPEPPINESQASQNGPNRQAQSGSSGQPSTLGVETNPTRAQGDTWDDDFEDVDDETFDPSTFRDNDSEDEEDNEEVDEDEETITLHIYLKDKDSAENGVGEANKAVETVEREEEHGQEGERRVENGNEEQNGEGMDENRLVRSMSPSPQPLLVDD